MAGIMDEFDPPTPLSKTYCSKLSEEEYENQSSKCTEEALSDLINYLENNSNHYKTVIRKREKEELENKSLFSYVKVKLTSFFSGEDSVVHVSDSKCRDKLTKLKTDMIKAYDYSQESKGRRFSKRLAEKRLRKKENTVVFSTPAARPPPPPPPPPVFATPIVHAALTRRPLVKKQCQHKDNGRSADVDSFKGVMQQLKSSGCKRQLRRRVEKSPGGTPTAGWPKRAHNPELMPYFNTKLVDKFKNTHSPHDNSPTHSMASPGSFGSPAHPLEVSCSVAVSSTMSTQD